MTLTAVTLNVGHFYVLLKLKIRYTSNTLHGDDV